MVAVALYIHRDDFYILYNAAYSLERDKHRND